MTNNSKTPPICLRPTFSVRWPATESTGFGIGAHVIVTDASPDHRPSLYRSAVLHLLDAQRLSVTQDHASRKSDTLIGSTDNA